MAKKIRIVNLTWHDQNKCYIKKIGYIQRLNGRKPRYFYYRFPKTAGGRNDAELAALQDLIEWRKIKARTIKGQKPIWYNEKLASSAVPNPFETATVSPEADAAPEIVAEKEKISQQNNTTFKNINANQKANPTFQLVDATIEQAIETFLKEYKASGVEDKTHESFSDTLRTAFLPIITTQQFKYFKEEKIKALVDYFIARTRKENQGKKLAEFNIEGETKITSEKKNRFKPRSAKNLCQGIKTLLKWYAKKVKPYQLPDDFDDIFKGKRFKQTSESIHLTEDGEDLNFEIYSPSDLTVLFQTCTNARDALYVLLGLNSAMYYVDIAAKYPVAGLFKQNVYLDRDDPRLVYKRKKQSHHADAPTVLSFLFPETAALLKQEMNQTDNPLALLDENNKPLTPESLRRMFDNLSDRAAKILTHRKSVRHMDLRKTGATAIANISSTDISDMYLGHKVKGVNKVYIKLAKERLKPAMDAWYQQLKLVGVFEPLKRFIVKTKKASVAA